MGLGIAASVILATILAFESGIEKSQEPSSKIQEYMAQNKASSLITGNGSPGLGSKDAPITMIEFGDYQCFYCNKFYHTTEPDIDCFQGFHNNWPRFNKCCPCNTLRTGTRKILGIS